MSQIWNPVDDVELYLDVEDYETAQNYEKAFEILDAEGKAVQKIGNGSATIKSYCQVFFNLFDNIFGKGTSEKIFKGKINSRLCDEIYESFLAFVASQKTDTESRRQHMISTYGPKKKVPQDHLAPKR